MSSVSHLARLARAFVFLGVLVLLTPGLQAQDSEPHRDSGLVFETPAGWSRQVGESQIVVSYIPPVQNDVIIEVRRLDLEDEKADVLFSESFHTQLRHAGLKVESRGAMTGVTGVSGVTTTYLALAETGTYRLVIAEFEYKEDYWLISGFFDSRRFDAYLRVFNRFLEAIAFEE